MRKKKKKEEEADPEEELADDEEWEYVWEDVEEDDDEEDDDDDDDDDDEEDDDDDFDEHDSGLLDDEEDDDDEEDEDEEVVLSTPRVGRRASPPVRMQAPPSQRQVVRTDPRRESVFHRRGGRPRFTPTARRRITPSDFGRGVQDDGDYEWDGTPWEEREAQIRAGEYEPGPRDSWAAQMLYKILKQGGKL